MQLSIKDIANMIDHTNLKTDATIDEMKKLCDEAIKYNFKMVAVNQVQTKICSEFLKESDVHVGAAIAFPLGQTTVEVKEFETQNAIDNGADEIDYVINLSEVKNNNFEYIEDEMSRIVKICRENNVISKVIFENSYLSNEEIIKLSKIAKNVEPDFIKTSTGTTDVGALPEHVKLMKDHVGEKVKVKAAGGIRTADSLLEMIECGAERIGCSAGISIIEELKNK